MVEKKKKPIPKTAVCSCLAMLRSAIEKQFGPATIIEGTALIISNGEAREVVGVRLSYMRKSRGRSVPSSTFVAGTFCPFCGRKYSNRQK